MNHGVPGTLLIFVSSSGHKLLGDDDDGIYIFLILFPCNSQCVFEFRVPVLVAVFRLYHSISNRTIPTVKKRG
jgi:hypothetical protein